MSAEERNLEPTQRHRQKMRQQGEVALSRDLVSASMLLAGMLLFWGFGGFLASVPIQGIEEAWSREAQLQMTPDSFLFLWNSWVTATLLLVVPVLAVIPITTALVSLVQTRFLFLPSRLALNWKHVNPAEGLSRIVSLDSLAAAGFGLAKTALVAAFIFWMVVRQIPLLLSLCQMDFAQAVEKMQGVVLGTGLQIAFVLFLLALADYGWQFYRHQQRLRMTFEEMKEEIRITEGNAAVRQKRKN